MRTESGSKAVVLLERADHTPHIALGQMFLNPFGSITTNKKFLCRIGHFEGRAGSLLLSD